MAGLLAAAFLTSCGGKKEPDIAPVVTVDVAPVLLSKIQRTIRADALLYPRQQAAIAPKISSPVKKTYVQRGTSVHAGQLLLELENQDLAGAATESRASLNLAEATFQTTSRATVPEELQKAELDARRRTPLTRSNRSSTTASACIAKAPSRRKTSTTRRSA